MMTGNNHLLEKVTFEIGLASQDGAFEIQNRISNAFQSGILRELERFFDTVAGRDKVITIEKIEIDLGQISSARLEEDLQDAFEKRMADFFAAVREEVSRQDFTPSNHSHKINIRWSAPNNAHCEAEVTVSDNTVSHYEKVIHLLQYGILPGAGSEFEVQKLSALINEVLSEHATEFTRYLKANVRNTRIIQRLVLNLNAGQLQYIAANLGCPFSSELNAITGRIENFFTANERISSDFVLPMGIIIPELKRKIWWHILQYYIGNSAERKVPTVAGADEQTRLVAELLTETLTTLALRSGSINEPSVNPESTGLLLVNESIRLARTILSPKSSASALKEGIKRFEDAFTVKAKQVKAEQAKVEKAKAQQAKIQQAEIEKAKAREDRTQKEKSEKEKAQNETPQSKKAKGRKNKKDVIGEEGIETDASEDIASENRASEDAAAENGIIEKATPQKDKDRSQDQQKRNTDITIFSGLENETETGSSLKETERPLLKHAYADTPASNETVIPENGIYVRNAGLIILAPYLRHFFLRLGLLDAKSFVSTEASWKAVHLLQYLCGLEVPEGDEGWSEHDLVFNKIVCGIDISEPVPEQNELTAADKEEADELLASILNNWTIMRRSSIYALQSTFLQKKGRLSKQGNDWELIVERDSAVEILIDKLPWSISMIKLPWNDYMILTQW